MMEELTSGHISVVYGFQATIATVVFDVFWRVLSWSKVKENKAIG
jgi:hypothetical protein